MILTCPRCATRYLVDDLQVWTTGRTVKCDACGQQWRAVGTGARPPSPPPAAEGPGEDETPEPPRFAPLSPPPPVPPPAPKAAAADQLFISARTTGRAPGKKPARKGMPADLMAALALVAVAVLALTVVERHAIVREIPGLAGVYSAIGLPADPAAQGRPGSAP